MPASSKSRGTAATTRLRKLECDAGCGYIVRVSRAAMLRGLPSCYCGGQLAPDTLEDALACVEAGVMPAGALEDHGEHAQYMRELSSITRGQASHVQRGAQSRGTLAVPEQLAHQRVVKERHARADRLRIDALKLHNPRRPAAGTDDLPF